MVKECSGKANVKHSQQFRFSLCHNQSAPDKMGKDVRVKLATSLVVEMQLLQSWISLCTTCFSTAGSTSQNVFIGRDFYINNTFDIFLIYTNRDHTASHAEMYSKITPEATKVPAPDKLLSLVRRRMVNAVI